jgi:hypothetical protein
MRENFTTEEWSTLIHAPMQAVMGICLADRVDPVSFLQNVRSGIAIVSEEVQHSDVVGDLTPALLGGLAELDAADTLAGERLLLKKQFELLGLIQTFKTAKEGRDYAIAYLCRVAVVLDTKVTDVQASELKQWLVSVATKVAETDRKGGMMGLGASRISDQERAMLKKMSEALGL